MMKLYLILTFLLVSLYTFSQNQNPETKVSGAYVNIVFNNYFDLNINDFLSTNEIPEISKTSFGTGIGILHIRDKIGFKISGGVDFNSNLQNERRTTMSVFNGRIGPSISVLSTDLQNTYFSALYGFDFYNLSFTENKDTPLNESNFLSDGGNTILISRNGHSIGGMLTIDANLLDNNFLLNVGYFYTLNNSKYIASGYNGIEGFPNEQNQIVTLSLSYRFKNFRK